MSVPGSNQLNRAFRLIKAQQITYLAWTARTKTSTGTLVSTYANGRPIRGSLQPVARTLLEMLGLDLQRHYVNIYVAQAVIDIRRDVAGDQFVYNGAKFEAISITKWLGQDGWNAVLAVEIPANAG